MAGKPFTRASLAKYAKGMLLPRLNKSTSREWGFVGASATNRKTDEGPEFFCEAKFRDAGGRAVAEIGISTISPPRGVVHYAAYLTIRSSDGSIDRTEEIRTENPKTLSLWTDNILLSASSPARWPSAK